MDDTIIEHSSSYEIRTTQSHISLNQDSTDEEARDHPFDEFAYIDHASRDIFCEEILRRCDASVRRKRRRREYDSPNTLAIVEIVAANALKAHNHLVSPSVRFSRRSASYSGQSVYYPDCLKSWTLRVITDNLDAAGLIELNVDTQEWSPFSARGKFKRQSTLSATDELVELAASFGITSECVKQRADKPVVILKDGAKRLAEYNPDDFRIASAIEDCKAYNHFLAGHKLDLRSANGEFLKIQNTPTGNGGQRPLIDLRSKALVRIFNHDSFEQGGRFYHGWWIDIPKQYRHLIEIDGQPICELDYSACFLRMLYHQRGIEPKGDPYEIPEIWHAARTQGLSIDKVRDAMKALYNVLINSDETMRIGKFPQYTRQLPKGYRMANKVYPLIEKNHEPVADAFRTGAGLTLMNKESEICRLILKAGLEANIVVLPIHDSFIVSSVNLEWLRKTMNSAYRQMIGYDPVIRTEIDGSIAGSEWKTAKTASNLSTIDMNPSIGERISTDTETLYWNPVSKSRGRLLIDSEERWGVLLEALGRK